MAMDDCAICGQQIRGDEPAVDQARLLMSATWVPFVEDYRVSDARLVHPACYAAKEGLDDLLKVLHKNDRRNRDEIFALIRQVEELQGRGS